MARFWVDVQVFDLIGVLGVAFYAGTYLFVSLGRCDSNSIAYYVLNGVAATCVLVSLTRNFNVASFMVEVLYISISLFGLARRLGRPAGRRGPGGGSAV